MSGLRKITPTSTAPYRLRFLTLDFPADGSIIVEWRYSLARDAFDAVVKRRSGFTERFVEKLESIPARDWSDEAAAAASERIAEAARAV